jgi:hypothetical protein
MLHGRSSASISRAPYPMFVPEASASMVSDRHVILCHADYRRQKDDLNLPVLRDL